MDSAILSVYQDQLLADGRTVTRFTDGNDEWRKDFAVDNNLQYRFGTGPLQHTALIGFDYQHLLDWISFKGGFAPDLDLFAPNYHQLFPLPPPYIQNKYRTTNYGLYAQDQIKFDERWILTIGGRQDWARIADQDELSITPVQKQKDQKLTYRGGLTYLTDFGLAPYVSYTQSFLPQAGSDFFGTPFEPTTGEQYEAGIKYQPLGLNALATAAVFDLTKQNVLTPDPSHPECPFCEVQLGDPRAALNFS